MSDDFIIEDESGNEVTVTSSSSSRPFLILAGALGISLILALLCTYFVLFNNGDGDQAEANPTRAAIETQNAIVAVTNEAVTATIAAMETEAAMPTETPTTTPTNTPVPEPTDTPTPTNTPVVSEAEEDTPTPQVAGTSEFPSGGDGVDSTPTPIVIGDGSDGGTSGGSLPETGIDTWTAFLAALAFIGVFLAARRLRG